MKITFLVRLFDPHVGGVERHVAGLANKLVGMGYSVAVITEQFEPELKLQETVNGVEVWRLPYSSLGSKRALWAEMAKLQKVVMGAEVVHIHDVFWWFVPYLLNKRFYMTFHGYEGSGAPRWQAKVQRKTAEMLAQGSICIGDFMRKWYWAQPDIVSYGAAKIPEMPERSGPGAVFLGRFDVDTGAQVYAQAFQDLHHLKQLDFYGGGPLVSKLAQYGQGIQIHPWVQNVTSALKSARYAMVSRYLAILEAMQAKRLVMAVYNNEIKKDYLYCHPMKDAMLIAGSAKELADKFNALTDADEKRMVEKAYVWAKEQTWQKLAGQYLQLWRLV